MGFFDALLSPLTDLIKNAITGIVQVIVAPILSTLLGVLISTLSPLLTTYIEFMIKIIMLLVPQLVEAILVAILGPGHGWAWVVEVFTGLLFLAGYGLALFGYAFIMRFLSPVVSFLPLSILLILFIVPLIPPAYLVYVVVTTFQTLKGPEKQDFMGWFVYILDKAVDIVNKTKNFFIDNYLLILLNLAYITLYQFFLAIYDLITIIPAVSDKLDELGFTFKVVITIILYFPYFWVVYAFIQNSFPDNYSDPKSTSTETKAASDIPMRILFSIKSVVDTIAFAVGFVIGKIVGIYNVIVNPDNSSTAKKP